MSSPSIVSASQIPFFFGRKKGGKGQSIVRGKPVTSPKNASSSSDGIDWSSDDMMQHPIDESPRKVSVSVVKLVNSDLKLRETSFLLLFSELRSQKAIMNTKSFLSKLLSCHARKERKGNSFIHLRVSHFKRREQQDVETTTQMMDR